MADVEKVQGWIKTLWPLVVAIAVVLVTYTRTESKQEYLSQTLAQIARL
jgi:L-lactate permease